MIIKLAGDEAFSSVRNQIIGSQDVRRMNMAGRPFVTVSGDEGSIDVDALKATPGVLEVIDTGKEPYYFASRKYKPEPTVISVGGVEIGGPQVAIIAGPCAVENLKDTLESAEGVKKAGAHLLRAGAFKPRTGPYNFQGLGLEGLKILAEVGRRTGMKVVSEVLSPEDVEVAAEYVDVVQVGMFNMTNTALLKRLGRIRKPVLLKRGASSTLVNLLKAAEFIIYNGNPQVILCERGIKTHEDATRFTLDVSAVPVLKRLSHLPVVVDPSHAAGHKDLVPVLARCAIVAGADGLLIESHVAPERMIKPGDAAQALLPAELRALMEESQRYCELMGRSIF